MENETHEQLANEFFEEKNVSPSAVKKDHYLAASVLLSSLVLSATWIYTEKFQLGTGKRTAFASGENRQNNVELAELTDKVLPSRGVTLPVVWGDLGAKLVAEGVIDADKFKSIYTTRGTFTKEYNDLLLGDNNGNIKITNENSGYLLNLFWALGLASKNPILDSGEMTDSKYGGAEKFASTGGWTISKGSPMEHYSRHEFFTLTPREQALVDKVSRGVYRPCCGNSTHFPDCNHGMAMLGLLELMAAQGVSEEEMWKTALTVNAYWFPNNYLTIATYMKKNGVDWNKVNPQEILGVQYSSAQGFRAIATQVSALEPRQGGGGSGCGIDGGNATVPSRQQVGCGL